MPKQKLSQHFADNLPAVPDGKKSIEYNDPDIRGFHIRQNAGSTIGTWVYSYTNAAGKRSHVNLGRTDVMPFEEARALAIEKRLEVRAGRDPAYERLQAKRVLTLTEFYEQHYLPYIKPRLRTWRRYASYWNCRVRDRFGHVRLDKIALADVQALQAEIVEDGGKPATADAYVKFMKRMLVLAQKWSHIQTNPLDHVELFNADNKVQNVFTDQEMGQLMQQLSIDRNREVACLLTFLVASGMRRGEAFNAKWSDVDLRSRTIRVDQQTAKTGVSRYVPLNDLALAVIDECKSRRGQHRSDYLFENSRTGTRYTDIRRTWARILRDAGIPHHRVHDIRHGFCSALANSGVSLYVISRLAGHQTSATTERYAWVNQETLHRESDRLGQSLLQTLQSSPALPDPGNNDDPKHDAA